MLTAKHGGGRGDSNFDGQIDDQIMRFQKNDLADFFRERWRHFLDSVLIVIFRIRSQKHHPKICDILLYGLFEPLALQFETPPSGGHSQPQPRAT